MTFLFRLPRTLDRQFQDAFPYRNSMIVQSYETKMAEGFAHNKLQMLVSKPSTMEVENIWENVSALERPIERGPQENRSVIGSGQKLVRRGQDGLEQER